MHFHLVQHNYVGEENGQDSWDKNKSVTYPVSVNILKYAKKQTTEKKLDNILKSTNVTFVWTVSKLDK